MGEGASSPSPTSPEVKERRGLVGLELPNPYEMVLTTAQGERIEIPWDFARHYCDESYRPTVEALAMRGRQRLANASPSQGRQPS